MRLAEWERGVMETKYRIAAGITAVAISLGIAFPAVAHAQETQYQLINTAGLGAYPRSETVFASRTGQARPEVSWVSAACWVYGDTVTNPNNYSSNVWVRDTSGFFWPEVWLDTGSDGVPPGLAACSPPAATAIPNSFYNRAFAVKWARSNTSSDPTNVYAASACTWFVSNALWRGGFPKDAEWTSEGEHGRLRKVPGSVTAWAVPELFDYLTLHNRFDVTVVDLPPERFRSNAVPEAELGDLIVYDWDGAGTLDHFTMITEIAPGHYPEVSEWGVNNNYPKRGWTYSVNDDTWLQQHNPNVHAKLIHFSGGVWIDVPEF